MPCVLNVQDLTVHFPLRTSFLEGLAGKPRKVVRAVDGVSFSIDQGEILALVGESGCGKTTTGKAVLDLLEPTVVKGRIEFLGIELRTLGTAELRQFRRQAQMIFQDPYQSLNPRETVYDIVSEPLAIHHLAPGRQERWEKVVEALEDAGLKPAEDYIARYPHELSGGQRQRVAIAGSLILGPRFLVADEPVSMLDVSVRADILKLIAALRDRKVDGLRQGISTLFITHDLALAWILSDRVGIMYLGRIVESGPSVTIIRHPLHPYSRALVDVMPRPEPRRGRQRTVLRGEAPNPAEIPPGCRFHPRCPVVLSHCADQDPPLLEVEPGHQVACWRVCPSIQESPNE